MENRVRPVFILSAPRTGSTLLQRILGVHSQINEHGEIALLLPFLYTLRLDGVNAEYGHSYVHRATELFCEALPDKVDGYLRRVRELMENLYNDASIEGTKYFVDKTPSYALIAEEVISLFPDAKFIVLWRNPLATIASAAKVWSGGRRGWKLSPLHKLITTGLLNLIEASQKHKDRICFVRFEDLVASPEAELRKIMAYLGLDYEADMIKNFSQIQRDKKMGDPIGAKKYKSISREPLEEWKKNLAGLLRKVWCRRYLKWLGKDNLSTMGYDLEELLKELNAIPTRYRGLLTDCRSMIYDVLALKFKKRLWRKHDNNWENSIRKIGN